MGKQRKEGDGVVGQIYKYLRHNLNFIFGIKKCHSLRNFFLGKKISFLTVISSISFMTVLANSEQRFCVQVIFSWLLYKWLNMKD